MDQSLYLYEKETAYFGFYPLEFVDRVINEANEQIYQATDRFLTILRSSDDSHLISPFQLEEGILKMLTLLESTVDKNFDIFEMYTLKNIFRFPSKLAYTENPGYYNEETGKEIELLYAQKRREWKAAKVLHSKLTFENQKISQVFDLFQTCFSQFTKLRSGIRLDPLFPLSDSIKNIQTQMKALKDLVSTTLDQSQTLLRLTTEFKGKGWGNDGPSPAAPSTFNSNMANAMHEELSELKKVGELDHLKAFLQTIQDVQ